MRFTIALGVAVTLSVLWMPSAQAESPAAPSAAATGAAPKPAEALFSAALQRFDAKDYAGALPLFREALNMSHSPNARLYVGLCLSGLGQYPEAYLELETTVRETADRASQDAKYGETREAAMRELALLERRVGKVVVKITEQVVGGFVTLNGVVIEPDKLGLAIPVTPGSVVVSSSAADRPGERKDDQVAAGEVRVITLSYGLPSGQTPPSRPIAAHAGTPPAAPSTAPLAAASDAPAEQTGGGVRTAGFVVAGLGVASMVAFGISAAVGSSKYSTLEDACGSARCTDPSYSDVVAAGRKAQTAANVTLAVGLTALAGGALMIIFGGPSADSPPSAAPSGTSATSATSATFALGPDSGHLLVGGVF
jgi:hypothetical protein